MTREFNLGTNMTAVPLFCTPQMATVTLHENDLLNLVFKWRLETIRKRLFDKGVSAHSPSLLGHPLILVVRQVQCHPDMTKKNNYLTKPQELYKTFFFLMAPCMLHSR